MKEVSSDEMYGIAKKFNHDMEQLKIEDHSAIVELVRVGRDLRNIKLQAADKEQQDAMRRQAMETQRKQLEQNEEILRVERERRQQKDLANAPVEVLTPQ